MKTIEIKSFTTLLIVILTIFGQYINAADYQTFYLDSINNNDTIIYCSGNDSVRLIPPTGADVWAWITNNDSDTILVDTLILPNGCEGLVRCQGAGIVAEVFYIFPFKVDAGEDKTTICGGSTQLKATSNYTGTGMLSYAWSPTTGLDNSTIFNPMAAIINNIKYTVTIIAPIGCQSTDSISVFIQPMNNPDICMVGVDSTNKNIIVWEKPVSTSIDSFYIYKETIVTDVFKKISAVAFHDYSVFVDTTSNPNIQSNRYQISLIDTCGFESEKSPFHKTMHLLINQGQNNVWNLIWEPYEGFTVSTYYINRGTDVNNLQLIGTSPASNTQYSDFSAPTGLVYYQIEIVNPNNCNPGKKSSLIAKTESYNTSRSNIATNSSDGINNNLLDSELITLYPNPGNNEIIIELEDNITNGIVEIIDMNGHVIQKVIMHSNRTIISIDKLNKGVYFVNIITGKEVIAQKFIKI